MAPMFGFLGAFLASKAWGDHNPWLMIIGIVFLCVAMVITGYKIAKDEGR